MQCSDHIGSEPLLGSHFGRPNKTIHLRDVSCKGTEKTLKDCKKSFIPFSIGSSSDYKSIDVVGVSCAGSLPSNGNVNPTPGSPGSPGSPSPNSIVTDGTSTITTGQALLPTVQMQAAQDIDGVTVYSIMTVLGILILVIGVLLVR